MPNPLRKVRLVSFCSVSYFLPVAYFRPKKAFWPKFSTVGGRVFFGVNGHFLWFIWPSYGHKKTMGMVVKKNFDRTQLSPYPIRGVFFT